MKKTACLFAMLLCVLSINAVNSGRVCAEGVSAELSLVLSRNTLNLGKTFSVTVYIKPNINVNISTFDLVLSYDKTKISPVADNDSVKIDKTTKIPDGFNIGSTLDGNEIVILGEDGTISLSSPIVVSGNTPIMVIYFKVKDNAAVGEKATFSINMDMTAFNASTGDNPVIPLESASPKSAEIGPRLDTNTYLSSIKPSTGTLTPAFSKSVYDYTVDVPEETDSVSFTAAAESSKAKAPVISGGTSLNFGANTVTIKVTAEDPDFTRVYTITVNRASPPTATPSPSPSPSPEPTEEVSEESSEVSSEDSSVISEDVTPTPPVIGPEDPGSAGPWKIASIVLAVLCAALAGTTIWLAVDKVRNRDKIVKVRRV